MTNIIIPMLKVSVGIAAYNEERNIRRCIDAVLGQDMGENELLEVIVVSSGSTDGTDDLVRSMMDEDPRIKLFTQEKREGKASASNLYMSEADGDILVQVNADAVLAPDALRHLMEPFQLDKVGAVAGRLVPVNDDRDFFGFAVNLVYYLHHAVSSVTPKMCELNAFRNLRMAMPESTNTDEDWLAKEVMRRGYVLAYAPKAINNIKGPSNLRDFLHQRIRINIGENYMKKNYDYVPPTKENDLVFNSFLDFIRDERPDPFRLIGAVSLEAMSRGYARAYTTIGLKDHNVWKVIESTREH